MIDLGESDITLLLQSQKAIKVVIKKMWKIIWKMLNKNFINWCGNKVIGVT